MFQERPYDVVWKRVISICLFLFNIYRSRKNWRSQALFEFEENSRSQAIRDTSMRGQIQKERLHTGIKGDEDSTSWCPIIELCWAYNSEKQHCHIFSQNKIPPKYFVSKTKFQAFLVPLPSTVSSCRHLLKQETILSFWTAITSTVMLYHRLCILLLMNKRRRVPVVEGLEGCRR